jgi:hypothetical protein
MFSTNSYIYLLEATYTTTLLIPRHLHECVIWEGIIVIPGIRCNDRTISFKEVWYNITCKFKLIDNTAEVKMRLLLI